LNNHANTHQQTKQTQVAEGRHEKLGGSVRRSILNANGFRGGEVLGVGAINKKLVLLLLAILNRGTISSKLRALFKLKYVWCLTDWLIR